jgi:hypothetical protein
MFVCESHLKRKTALLIALVMVTSIVLSYLVYARFFARYFFPGKYDKSIIRNTDNVEEENALAVAENADYSAIFNVQRFTTWDDSNETWPYTWANLIDSQVIEYYDDRFESLKGTSQSIEFHYETNVYTWDQIHVVYIPAPTGGNIHNDSIQVLSQNGSLLFENADFTGPTWGMQFAYRYNSEHQAIQANQIDFSFSKSYVIEMQLKYNEVWGSLAAFYADVYQIIIVDQNFVPRLLCVQSAKGIS